MTTLLFFDDQQLTQRDNVVRKIGQPQLLPDSVYEDPYVNIAWGFPSVFWNDETRTWRMLYWGCLSYPLDAPHPDPSTLRKTPLLAESADGLHWAPYDTSRHVTLPDRWLPHQVLPLDHFAEWPACYIDPRADKSERIKGLVVWRTGNAHMGSRLWVSPDGVHWTLKEGIEWQKEAPDPGVSVFWNEVRKSYTFTTRPDLGDRRVAVFETTDWVDFSKPELALQTDALDTPLAQCYGMPVIPYEGYYVGFLWVYHVPPTGVHKYTNGHVDVQLAYSLNGWHFQRGLRDPFIANGEPGTPDSGCVYPTCAIQKDDGSLWIYACASAYEHGHRPEGSGSMFAYRLRRDGFVYLESTGGEGNVGTRCLYLQGGEVELNVQSPCGYARVQVTDASGTPLPGYTFAECQPLSGDDTSWQPKWNNGKDMASLAGQVVRLEVLLNNSRLYAIRGNFLSLPAWSPVARFNQFHEVPQARPGF